MASSTETTATATEAAEESSPGPEAWVPAALAAQEEHIKRSSSCRGQVGHSHAFRKHGRPGRPPEAWSECIVCGVTETAADYRAKAGA